MASVLGSAPVSAAELLEEAAERAGTDRWGDLAFVPTLELLLESCHRTAALNPRGWLVLRKVALRHLRNRLYLQAHLDAHPNVPARPLRCALVVTGLPRTGTTLLQALLALDPAHRVLRLWEALHPVPPEEEGPRSRAALLAHAESWLRQFYELAPAVRSIHALTADGPEECDVLMQNAFASQHFDDMFDAADYSAWLQHAPLAGEYAYFALQLRALSGPAGGEEEARSWALKSPSHLGHLDALTAAVPDALVVQCHRQPLEAVPSYASLVMAVRGPNSDAVDPAAVGRQALERCATAVGRALAVREAVGEERFVDVPYPTLVRDPVGVVAALYERLGRPLGPLEPAMRRWLAENPQHRHGPHRYTLDQFGLEPGLVERCLAGYAERFGWAFRGDA